MTDTSQHTLMFVDDEPSITKALRRLFRKAGYHILTASSGIEGIELLKKSENPVSLIISDQRMPGMNGARFLENAKQLFPDAIRFLLTGYSDMDAVVDAINKGEIHRYLTKPWNDNDLIIQVKQALGQYELVLENRRLMELTGQQNKKLNELNKSLEKKVEERTREIKEKNRKLKTINLQLEKSFKDTIRLLSSLVGTLNPDLGRYMGRVGQLARYVAIDLGLSSEEINQIEMAGMIHDIGLLGVPKKTMKKDESRMDDTEFKIYSQHPMIAQGYLQSVEVLHEVGEIILFHHESFDGSGFPYGLKGNEIPMGSQIIRMVSDYCRITELWPKDINQIHIKAKKYIGPAKDDLLIDEPEKMLEQVAQKAILIGANQKYDIEIVTKFIKILQEDEVLRRAGENGGYKTVLIKIEDLKEGMILLNDIRLKDGRLLLVKGTVLKDSSIKTVQAINTRGLIKDGNICVALG